MHFKVLEPDFLHGTTLYSKDNCHDSGNIDDMTDDHVEAYHEAGFISIEDREDCQRDIHKVVVVKADNVKHNTLAKKV